MPPFRLTLGDGGTRRNQTSGPPASLPRQQLQEQEEEEGQGQGRVSEEASTGSVAGKGGRGWPVRTVWVPNGFEDGVAYRSVFCGAMQV